MATQEFSKVIRPESGRTDPITDRDLDIVAAILRYRDELELARVGSCHFRRLRSRPMPKDGS